MSRIPFFTRHDAYGFETGLTDETFLIHYLNIDKRLFWIFMYQLILIKFN